MDKNESEFGENGIIEIIKQNMSKPVIEIKKLLSESIRTFTDNKSNSDDLTIILAKHE